MTHRTGHRLAHSAALSMARIASRIAGGSVATARPRDTRSHAASEGRYRGSDLAVTAPELNARAGVAAKKDGEETPGPEWKSGRESVMMRG